VLWNTVTFIATLSCLSVYRFHQLTYTPMILHMHTHTHPFYGDFSGTTQLSRCQKKASSGLYGAREDNRGRHTNNPAGRHSIWTNQRPTFLIPHFYVGCPSCHNPPNLSCLGTGTRYAGLHTQWLGSYDLAHWQVLWVAIPTLSQRAPSAFHF